MSVIRWKPLSELADARFTPLADIAETDAGYVIELELPGFAAADVAVTVQDGVLSVAGERKPTHLREVATGDNTENKAGEAADNSTTRRRVHRAERAFGKFERRFRLPKDADAQAVSAQASDGVLTLEIARLAEATPRSIEVKVA